MIKVGGYVRDHINGIGQVIKCYDNELEIVFKRSRAKTSVSSYFEYGLNKVAEKPIDLIAVGDYVNGCKITYINEPNEYNSQRILNYEEPEDYVIRKFNNEDIKTILTKEQFEREMYRVNE